MIEFRDSYTKEIGAELIVHQNHEALEQGANPFALGTQKCCGLLKTKSLLDALAEGGFDAAFGGARRDEEKSRAKERIYSFRDRQGQWDPKNQRPELWNIFNSPHQQGREAFACFRSPIGPNWTSGSTSSRKISPSCRSISPSERRAVIRGGSIVLIHPTTRTPARRAAQLLHCRMRSLGCVPCTGAIRSEADTRSQNHRGDDSRSAARSARIAPSITTKRARWRSRSARATSDARRDAERNFRRRRF